MGSNVSAQISNYRVIRGRLFNFRTPGEKYLVSGTVTSSSMGLSVVQHSHQAYKYVGSPGLQYEGPEGLLQAAAAFQASSRSKGIISAGEYFIMSSEMRANYQLTRWNDTFTVTNVNLSVGQKASFYAWPVVHNGRTIYDYGTAFTGNSDDFKEVFVIVGDSFTVKRVPTKDEIAAEKANKAADTAEAIRIFRESLTNSALTNSSK